MLYRKLGSSGLVVSVVGVGTWQFGGEWGKSFSTADVDAILGAALDEGINLVDTAECYGDHLSERLIGERIRRERSRWVVATKFGHHFHGHMDRTRHFDPAAVEAQLNESLRALQTDYIDLLQFHSPVDEEFNNPALWKTLANVKRSGKVRHVGLSVAKNDNLFQIETCPAAGLETVQIVYNRLDRTPEQSVFGACRRLELGVLARVPLASGLLSGKYRRGVTFGPGDWRAEREQAQWDAQIAEVERIAATEVPSGVPMAEWALAWPLRHPAVSCVIPGVKDVAQMRANAAAARRVEDAAAHPYAVTAPTGAHG